MYSESKLSSDKCVKWIYTYIYMSYCRGTPAMRAHNGMAPVHIPRGYTEARSVVQFQIQTHEVRGWAESMSMRQSPRRLREDTWSVARSWCLWARCRCRACRHAGLGSVQCRAGTPAPLLQRQDRETLVRCCSDQNRHSSTRATFTWAFAPLALCAQRLCCGCFIGQESLCKDIALQPLHAIMFQLPCDLQEQNTTLLQGIPVNEKPQCAKSDCATHLNDGFVLLQFCERRDGENTQWVWAGDRRCYKETRRELCYLWSAPETPGTCWCTGLQDRWGFRLRMPGCLRRGLRCLRGEGEMWWTSHSCEHSLKAWNMTLEHETSHGVIFGN